MKNPIVCIITILFPFLTFCQWTDIVPTGTVIMINSSNYEKPEPIILTKFSDKVTFSDWKRDLKLNGIPSSYLTGEDFSFIDAIDSSELEEAYNAACVGCPLKRPTTTPQAAIELIEMQFLYRGYDNVFKLAASWPSGVKEYRIEATDATVKTITRNNQIMHTVNPKGKTSEVKVIYKDSEGFEKEFGPWIYAVRALPMPFITNNNISKSSGGRINIGLNESLSGVNFEITRLEFGENLIITDSNIIPAEMLKKTKIGKMIPITVTANNLLTEEEVLINGSLQVVE